MLPSVCLIEQRSIEQILRTWAPASLLRLVIETTQKQERSSALTYKIVLRLYFHFFLRIEVISTHYVKKEIILEN